MPIIVDDPGPFTGTDLVLDPSEIAEDRIELSLNSGAINVGPDGPDWGDAQIEQYLAEAARGQVPVDFRIPNRIISIPLVLGASGSAGFNSARRQLQAKVALFQREGGWLKRGDGLYCDIVNASLRLPDKYGHHGVEYEVVLTLEAIPDFYEDEVELDDIVEITEAEIVQVLQQGGVPAVILGDHPGRVRIVVDEDDGETQLGLIWGFRSRRYSSEPTAALAYEAEDLTPLDAAAIATVSGASGGASDNVVQHASLSASSWSPVLSTEIDGVGHMTHVGTYRVWARVLSTSNIAPQVRLAWDVGDLTLPEENVAVQIARSGALFVVDLGEVRIDRAPYGTHQWQAIVQAKSGFGAGNISVDKVWFQPIDDGGARITVPLSAESAFTAHVARDEFDQSAGALVGKTAPIGGTWAGDGDADDFDVDGAGRVARDAVSDTAGLNNGRFALCGSTDHAQIQAQATCAFEAIDSDALYQSVLVRYVDTSNWLIATFARSTTVETLSLVKCVAGTPETLASATVLSVDEADEFTIRVRVDSTGRARAWMWLSDQSASQQPQLDVTDTDLATGGTLEDGRVGIHSHNASPLDKTPEWLEFSAFVPITDAVIYPNQTIEVRTDGVYREGAAGGIVGPLAPIGDLPRIPSSGIEERSVELFVKASRGDLDLAPDNGIDDVSAQVFYRPSWLQVNT